MNQVKKFIELLAKQRLYELGFSENLYKGKSFESSIRKWNLELYLDKMKQENPKTLLLGEAPGYKGCKLTGIPFSSEKIIYHNDFFSDKEYKFVNRKEGLEGEQSATIVWEELSKYKIKPLIWNIFPFHPFKENNLNSNRTPNKMELRLGKEILIELLKIFKISNFLAVGRKPELMLKEINIQALYIRHPANGGKKDFCLGLSEYLK